MATTHLELLAEWRIPVWSSGFWGYRYAGITGGLLQDMLVEGAATGLMATWLYPFSPREFDVSFDQPTDAIAFLGQDAGRPAYSGESEYQSVLPRLREKWTFWTGPPKAGMVEELAAAGLCSPTNPGAIVPGDASAPVDSHTPAYWSRFWLGFDPGEHPITGPGTIWGVFAVGSKLGPEGLTAEYHHTLRSIVRRYKPAQWVPWEYYFYLSGGEIIRLRGRANPNDPDYVYYTP